MDRPTKVSYSWVFRGIFFRSLIAGAIGGIFYAFLLLGLPIVGIQLQNSELDRALYSQLILSIFGAVFGLIMGAGFGFIDGIALSLLMSTERFTPNRNRLHLNLLCISSAAITEISVILVLRPLDFGANQTFTLNLALLALIAAVGAWWGAHQTLKNDIDSRTLIPFSHANE